MWIVTDCIVLGRSWGIAVVKREEIVRIEFCDVFFLNIPAWIFFEIRGSVTEFNNYFCPSMVIVLFVFVFASGVRERRGQERVPRRVLRRRGDPGRARRGVERWNAGARRRRCGMFGAEQVRGGMVVRPPRSIRRGVCECLWVSAVRHYNTQATTTSRPRLAAQRTWRPPASWDPDSALPLQNCMTTSIWLLIFFFFPSFNCVYVLCAFLSLLNYFV